MRFAQVDRKVTVNSVEHEPIEIKSGSDEVAVYFGWEMRGAVAWLLPCLVTSQPKSLFHGLFALRL